MAEQSKRQWLCLDLPTLAYSDAWDFQTQLVEARKAAVLESDLVLILEHAPVFTVGRRGGLKNLAVSGDYLNQVGVQVFHVERGGDITFHGPGQLVMYPVVDLKRARLGVNDYVEALEEVMIRVARDSGVEAGRSPKNRGVWVKDRKLGSIGIAVRKGISFHGMALNVDIALKPFEWIEPCGLAGVEMTSLALESPKGEVSMTQARQCLKRHVADVFAVELVGVEPDRLRSSLTGMTARADDSRQRHLPSVI